MTERNDIFLRVLKHVSQLPTSGPILERLRLKFEAQDQKEARALASVFSILNHAKEINDQSIAPYLNQVMKEDGFRHLEGNNYCIELVTTGAPNWRALRTSLENGTRTIASYISPSLLINDPVSPDASPLGNEASVFRFLATRTQESGTPALAIDRSLIAQCINLIGAHHGHPNIASTVRTAPNVRPIPPRQTKKPRRTLVPTPEKEVHLPPQTLFEKCINLINHLPPNKSNEAGILKHAVDVLIDALDMNNPIHEKLADILLARDTIRTAVAAAESDKTATNDPAPKAGSEARKRQIAENLDYLQKNNVARQFIEKHCATIPGMVFLLQAAVLPETDQRTESAKVWAERKNKTAEHIIHKERQLWAADCIGVLDQYCTPTPSRD